MSQCNQNSSSPPIRHAVQHQQTTRRLQLINKPITGDPSFHSPSPLFFLLIETDSHFSLSFGTCFVKSSCLQKKSSSPNICTWQHLIVFTHDWIHCCLICGLNRLLQIHFIPLFSSPSFLPSLEFLFIEISWTQREQATLAWYWERWQHSTTTTWWAVVALLWFAQPSLYSLWTQSPLHPQIPSKRFVTSCNSAKLSTTTAITSGHHFPFIERGHCWYGLFSTARRHLPPTFHE